MKILSPKFTRLGKRQTYTQRVAGAFNWYRRCVMGLMGQINFQSGYFIHRAPEFENMSLARKEQLDVIEFRRRYAKAALNDLLEAIEKFQTLPITLEDEAKNRLPKRRKKPEDATLDSFPN